MNSIERSLAILNHEPVDRLPHFDIIMNDEILSHYAGEKLTIENGERVVHKSLNNMVDATRWWVFYPQKNEVIVQPDGSKIDKQRWTSWHDTNLSLDEAVAFLKNDLDHSGEVDLDQEAKNIDEAMRKVLDIQKECPDMFLFGNPGLKTGFGWFASCGLETFSYLLVDEPDLLKKWLDQLIERHVGIIDRMQSLSEMPAVFNCDDMASKNGPLFSPDTLHHYFYPALEKLVDAFHRKGVKYMYHSDGDVMPMLDDLVATGIDGLNPLETIAGVNLKEVRQRFPELVMIGGIDCSQLLPFGTTDEVKKVTKQAIQDAGPWYFPGSSSEVCDVVPLDNMKAMIEVIRETRF